MSMTETANTHENGRLWWSIIAVLVIAIAGVAVFKIGKAYLYPQPAIEAVVDPSCDLQQTACVAQVPGGGTLRLSIAPRPIYAMEPLRIEVTADGIGLENPVVDFSGVNMNMGYNRFRLERTGGDQFSGDAVLPICIRNRMTWDASVMADSDRGPVRATFRFDTVARN